MWLNKLFRWRPRQRQTTPGVSRPPQRPASRRPIFEPLESRQLLSTLPAGFQEETFALDVNPAGFDFAPDGRMFVAEKQGIVRVIHPDGTQSGTPFFSTPVDEFRDRGLTAVLVDPDYEQNHYVYVYYTAAVPENPDVADNGAANRLVRLTASAANHDVADPASAVVILDGIQSPDGIHQGGFLRFGSDGMLYIGVGDVAFGENSQDLSNLYGKVLRLDVHNFPNLIPADNPFVGQPGKREEIWSYGFRNPFSGNRNPGTSEIFVNDVGGSSWEEINRLEKGGNYGWPLAEGMSSDPNFINPVYTYSHGDGGAAVVGGAFESGAAFPPAYSSQYFSADLVQGVIRTLNPATGDGSIWATDLSFPTDLDFGPDGNLYWSQIAPFGAIYKISYAGGDNRAPTAKAAADVTNGAAPLFVTFDASASTDPDGDPLYYEWDFGDGTIAFGVSVQHAYALAGTYHAVLTVRDRLIGGLTNTAPAIVVTSGNYAPEPTITAPLASDLYVAGQTIHFAGTATDQDDGELPPSAFHWSFQFGHNTHFHDFIAPIDGVTSGSFQIDSTGEVDPDQYYRILLTATDSGGLKTTTHRDIRPVTSTFTLASNIPGVQLFVDGQPVTAPTTTPEVVGMTRTLRAPLTQLVNGVMYRFVGWSDGGAAEHAISTPLAPTTYTAQYQAMPLAAVYSSTAKAQIFAGQVLKYKVTVTNVGTQTWRATGSSRVRLGVYFGGDSDAVGAWLKAPVRFALPKDIAPRKSFTFNVTITAPNAPGNYVLRHRLIKEPASWFQTLDRVNTTVDTLTATYDSTPPTLWGAGQPQILTVTVHNTGTAVWKASGPDRVQFGVYFGGASDTPGATPQRFNLPFDVAPGASATLTVDVIAPTKVGNYTLRQRMVHEQAGWFSSLVRTAASVELLSAKYQVSPPTEWLAGELKTYSIILTNNGSKTWKATGMNAVHLGVYFAGASDAVGDWNEEPLRFNLPRDVKPGQKVTLSVTIAAPLAPGNYVLRHRMVKEHVNWFNPMRRTNVQVLA